MRVDVGWACWDRALGGGDWARLVAVALANSVREGPAVRSIAAVFAA